LSRWPTFGRAADIRQPTAGGARHADDACQLSAGIKAPKGESDGRCRSETRSARRLREQAVERVTKPCGRKVPGAGRAWENRTSTAACVERRESPREELALLCRLASSVQGPEGRRNLRRGARADLKPSTRDGRMGRPQGRNRKRLTAQRIRASQVGPIPAGRTFRTHHASGGP
jgi:hypothetical protein